MMANKPIARRDDGLMTVSYRTLLPRDGSDITDERNYPGEKSDKLAATAWGVLSIRPLPRTSSGIQSLE